MRSFGIVEFKLAEADFFMELLAAERDPVAAEFYLSAFLSAARSVTFALQASLHGSPGFSEWYRAKQDSLRSNQVAAWSVTARNSSQKMGETFIRSASIKGGSVRFLDRSVFRREETVYDGVARILLERQLGKTTGETLDGEDIVTKCCRHLVTLVNVVHECFQVFGSIIDPEQYYTQQNLKRLQKSIEQCEIDLGLPAGWSAPGSELDRLRRLRHEAGEPEIDHIFCKYLGIDRFGRSCGVDRADG